MIQMSFPSPTAKQYVEQIKKIYLESFLKVANPPDPTQQYVKHVKKIGILSHFVDFVTVVLKALRSTY